MPRFFAEIDRFPVAFIGGRDSIRHILGPLRKKRGDEIAVRIGNQGYRARISSVASDKILLDILAEDTLRDRSPAIIHLALCLIDLKDLDDTIRSTTELGVSHIHPVISARSNVRTVTEARLARWDSIIMEAIKQCDRMTIPLIHQPLSLEAFLSSEAALSGTRLVAHKDARHSLLEYRGRDCLILIGPEGGLSGDELDMLAARGFIAVGMGNTTLRATTAAISAVAILGC